MEKFLRSISLWFVFYVLLLVKPANAQFQQCNFDNYNGSNGQTILVARQASASFPVGVSQSFLNIYFGNNASTSLSGMNEFEAGGVDITNYTGGDLSEAIVVITGLGFWTQNIPNTSFQYFTWDASTQLWSGILGDGSTAKMKILGGSVNGVDIPITSFQIMNTTNIASGYSFSQIPNTFSASFVDEGLPGGPTTHSTSGSVVMPNSLIHVKLGPLASGATLNNVRIKIGLSIESGGDTWVDYNADVSAAGDYDYYVQAETTLLGTTYDYGDAPTGYGIARHAPGLCENALYIGSARPDYEISVNGSILANEDDNNTGSYNDETNMLADYYVSNSTYDVTLPYQNNTGTMATLSAWIDWNDNSVFETNEQAWTPVPAGAGNAVLTWVKTGATSGQGTIPASLTIGKKLARFRIGSTASAVLQPAGTASDGEVEDLTLTVEPPFPVKLASFNALQEGKSITLKWQTTEETNADHFLVERSQDTKNWANVGIVAAKGESRQPTYYGFEDQQPLAGLNYYRLKMVDADGSFTYSRIAWVGRSTTVDAHVFPNPVADRLYLSAPLLQNVGEASLTAMDGRTTNLKVNAGSLNSGVNMAGFPSGTYILTIILKDGSSSKQKITVAH